MAYVSLDSCFFTHAVCDVYIIIIIKIIIYGIVDRKVIARFATVT